MMRYPSIILAAFVTQALAACECGYSVNGTTAEYFGLFTDAFETDFLHVNNMSDSATGWTTQVYNVTAQSAHGEYGKSFQLGNVIANPMADGHWNGDALGVGDPGLQLWVRSELEEDLVPVAEIATDPYDMLYGSYRAGIKMTGNNGTCGAFFWYRNDTREIDIEFLSNDTNLIHLIVQEPSTDNVMTAETKNKDDGTFDSAFKLNEGYHDYRFDWMPDRVDFYIDGMLARRYTDDVPSSPGHLMLSHWSNGNTGWSGGPPLQDAVMTVSYVKAYFNTTSRDVAKPGCTDLDAPGAVCKVQDQMNMPDPALDRGKTPFLTIQQIDTQSPPSVTPIAYSSATDTFGNSSLSVWAWLVGSLFGFGLFLMSISLVVE